MSKFVLSGKWEDGSTVYYMNSLSEFHGFKVRELTTSIVTATTFASREEAEAVLEKLHDPILKVLPVCPICGGAYEGHPAISREDNKTKICSDCGTLQALADFYCHEA